MSANTCFCLISYFLKFLTLLFEILEKYQNLTSCLGIYKYQSYYEFFENLKKNEIRQKLDICWHCLFWFDLPIRKEEGTFKQGKIMSPKVCQRFLYSLPTLGGNDFVNWHSDESSKITYGSLDIFFLCSPTAQNGPG